LAEARRRVPVRRAGSERSSADTDWLAVEEPLEIRVRCAGPHGRESRSLGITMRTPGEDEDLACGFLFTEGVIQRPTDVLTLRCDEGESGPGRNVIEVALSPDINVDFHRLSRIFYSNSSCGVCGKAALEALRGRAFFEVRGDALRMAPATLTPLPAALAGRQANFAATGGLHAAALFDGAGEIMSVREDVGRHNAVDKLIGASLRAGVLPFWNRGILVSGRASFEIVEKARMAGCPMVVAVGAPSSLAVDVAWECDMTLVGFLREERFNVYAGPSRIIV
jgi:FdhD protein